MRLTVSSVIPTHNRGERLGATLDPLLACRTDGIDRVEIIVVDDGSTTSLAPILESREVQPPFMLQCIRQPNSGPAVARNRGFRESRGDIVLFIDDDIIVPPDLILGHVKAHEQYPGSVVFGRNVPPRSLHDSPYLRYVLNRGYDPGEFDPQDYRAAESIASGNLSIERKIFAKLGAVYSNDFETPNAEEFDLTYRLRTAGIPMILANRIVAEHDQPITLDADCRRAYKHARGIAEYVTRTHSLDLNRFPELASTVATNRAPAWGDSPERAVKVTLKWILGRSWPRVAIRRSLALLEALRFPDRVLFAAYKFTLGLYYNAGFRDGVRDFSKRPSATRSAVSPGTSNGPADPFQDVAS